MNLFQKLTAFFLFLIALQGCGGGGSTSEPATTATVSTSGYSSVTATTAIVSANVSADGGATTTRGVCWSTSTNPTVSASQISSGTGTGAYTCTLTGLTASTTYYARAYATNSVGTVYGEQVSFTTTAPTAPVLTTTAATSVAATTAISGGTISSDGGSTVTARGICWSTSTGPTVDLSTKISNGTGTGTFSSTITGLTVNTVYYVRAWATNAVGTSYGSEISFTTSNSTSGTMSAVVTTTTYSGRYSPKHVMAAWIVNSSGTFVKSLNVYGNNYMNYLTSWVSASASSKTDATTGATLSNHGSVTCTWNGKNTSGTIVPDGTYKLCVEFTESDAVGKFATYSFTKGSSAASGGTVVTSSSNISLGSLTWTPN